MRSGRSGMNYDTCRLIQWIICLLGRQCRCGRKSWIWSVLMDTLGQGSRTARRRRCWPRRAFITTSTARARERIRRNRVSNLTDIVQHARSGWQFNRLWKSRAKTRAKTGANSQPYFSLLNQDPNSSSKNRAPLSKGWANSRSLYIGPFHFECQAKTLANSRAKTQANEKSIELPPRTQVQSSLLTDTRKLCFMDMTVNGEPLGRIDLELNYDITPKTAQNFR